LVFANATGRLPETLISNYQHTLRNNPEERTPSRRTEWVEFVRLAHVLVSLGLSNETLVVKANTVILSGRST
jgi:sulfur carrier protein ThiS